MTEPLSRLPLHVGLSLCGAAHFRHYRQGEVLWREGDPIDALFMVYRGTTIHYTASQPTAATEGHGKSPRLIIMAEARQVTHSPQ